MPADNRDPIEERDIKKILEALDDKRVIGKIANALAITKHKLGGETTIASEFTISPKND